MRSWLFIEGDNASKLAKAPRVGADAVVVDLSCIEPGEESEQACSFLADWLKAHTDPLVSDKAFARWVRIKPLDQPLWREDLMAIMRGSPEGVILPKTTGTDQIRMLASELYEIEQKLGLKHNTTKIIPQVGETPRAALTLHELINDRQPRLSGFAWNAQNVARGLGAKRTKCDDGRWTDALSHVRAMTLMLARSIGVMGIDTPTENPKDAEQSLADARKAKRDGFTGIAASHPAQVAAINEAYSLSAAERAEAEALLGLFASKATPKAELAPVEEEPEAEPAAPSIRKLG